METLRGPDIQKVIGVGYRRSGEIGEEDIASKTYFSYEANLLLAFEYYPVVKYFGITSEDAMLLPVDRWHRIRKAAHRLAERDLKEKAEQREDNQTLTELLKRLLLGGGGE